ncbi:MAG: hypothetical protein ACOX2K_08730 [Bacillota bacterium]|jgi:hypothetical protein
MMTIGNLWWLIVLSVVTVIGVWYWTTTASHRVVERISHEDPKLYNFRFRQKDNRSQHK